MAKQVNIIDCTKIESLRVITHQRCSRIGENIINCPNQIRGKLESETFIICFSRQQENICVQLFYKYFNKNTAIKFEMLFV